MNKIRVGLIYGGKSPEHTVSTMSAQGILNNIDQDKFEVTGIFIAKDGNFYTDATQSNAYDFFVGSKELDVYFPILHGAGGEDGEIQGLIKSVGKPFVGSDVLASAICLDKGITKQLFAHNNIPQTDFVLINFDCDDTSQLNAKLNQAKKQLIFPVFVKAANLGSSVGVYKVDTHDQLIEKCYNAKEYDSRVLIEQGIVDGREVEVSVLGNGRDLQCSVVGEIKVGSDFYDYDDKYKNNQAELIVPADLTPQQIIEITDLAKKVFMLTTCSGFARVDFFISSAGKILVSEINTIPGFTPISMYPKLWAASGLPYRDLIGKLIELGLSKRSS
ncbi:D-alanine--D-alanine ligase A [Candidatus Falkowbacteria bacterium CG10_big_fil_rev_8_21_14_0_10_39_11]|uniref:D-alanine--D-alanine ligase n=1 Tax=Candidatus Falkowbacteria bacterium CG10_big_fil_rev_8_21_14_0_10_39_11 TaxID=1974565 RepID=A0A2H0V4G3_9BACT|nr:MAG: D-alanine--D-alanine ligase A [Candidatus Falkowbacteria bacterium CG10_big_fil_rev_8_21_14_0_10_39_11]